MRSKKLSRFLDLFPIKSIANFQAEIETLLEDSPSLKNLLQQYLENQYPKAIRQFNKKYPQYQVQKDFTIEDIFN